MKKLSEWQAARVRDALRAYHRYERGKDDDEYFTWKDVREAIVEYTDVEIGNNARHGAERLRLFVDGVEDENAPGGRKFSEPKPAALKAIIAFVTHEDLNLLTEDEMQENMPGPQAGLRLTEYFSDECDHKRSISAKELEGEYFTSAKESNAILIVNLTIQRSLDETMVQVVETRDLYDTTEEKEASDWHAKGRKGKHASHCIYFGWSVLTPEDNVIFFMKAEGTGRNHIYITLNDVGLWLRSPGNKGPLFLLRQDFGVELGMMLPDFRQEWRTVVKDMRDKLLWLYRKPYN